LFTEALANFGAKSGRGLQAVDLGCGDGTETLALLEAGWTVLAIDREPAAIEYVRSSKSAATEQLYSNRRELRFSMGWGGSCPQ